MNKIFLLFLACTIVFLCISAVDIHPQEPPFRYSIRKTGYFPSESQIEKGCLLKNVRPFCTDGKQYIYVPDWNYATVYKFDMTGRILGSFGKKGQGPNEFQTVSSIASFSRGLVIIDAGNMRVSITDFDGKQLNAFRIFKAYNAIVASHDGSRIYLASRNSQTKLIDVTNQDGKLLASFGERIAFKNKTTALNDVFLSRNPVGDLWVAWKFFPIIRRYGSNGDLLSEFTIQDEAISDFVHSNEEVGNSIQTGYKTDLMGIINGFFVTDSYYYVFLYGKNVKPRIIEYNFAGKQEATYEIVDYTEKEIFVDLVVYGKGTEKTFYVLEGFPEARVDIFRKVITSN